MELLRQYQERKEKYSLERILALYRPWHLELPYEAYFAGLRHHDPAARYTTVKAEEGEQERSEAAALQELFIEDDEILACTSHSKVIELLKKRVHEESIFLNEVSENIGNTFVSLNEARRAADTARADLHVSENAYRQAKDQLDDLREKLATAKAEQTQLTEENVKLAQELQQARQFDAAAREPDAQISSALTNISLMPFMLDVGESSDGILDEGPCPSLEQLAMRLSGTQASASNQDPNTKVKVSDASDAKWIDLINRGKELDAQLYAALRKFGGPASSPVGDVPSIAKDFSLSSCNSFHAYSREHSMPAEHADSFAKDSLTPPNEKAQTSAVGVFRAKVGAAVALQKQLEDHLDEAARR
jgi:hypothetical protein